MKAMQQNWSSLAWLIVLLLLSSSSSAWTSSTSRKNSSTISFSSDRRRSTLLFAVEMKTDSLNSGGDLAMKSETETEGDSQDFEYIEYDSLTEEEFIGSEWLIGTNWDRNPDKIDETWARLIVDDSGKNVVVWGDKSEGTWTLDVASQFLSLSKNNVLAGKEIWACTVTDYYFLQGTVRAWKYWLPAAVMGQWQAKRLGVLDPDEAGTPPWFDPDREALPLPPSVTIAE